MKIKYWICSYKSNGKGQSKYTPIIEFENRDEAYKAMAKADPKKYTVLPQVAD